MRQRHGEAHKNAPTPEYTAWVNMISRCGNRDNISYPRYGGKGIVVCSEWRHDFLAFLTHVGRRPSPKHSLDRFPNTAGNYEPGNVRWATAVEQANNTAANHLFEFQGEKKTIPEWARKFNLPSSTVWKRLRMEWSLERALLTPVKRQANNAIPQARNAEKSSINVYYTHGGKERTLKEWAAELDLDYHTLYARVVTRGWSFARAVREPVR